MHMESKEWLDRLQLTDSLQENVEKRIEKCSTNVQTTFTDHSNLKPVDKCYVSRWMSVKGDRKQTWYFRFSYIFIEKVNSHRDEPIFKKTWTVCNKLR